MSFVKYSPYIVIVATLILSTIVVANFIPTGNNIVCITGKIDCSVFDEWKFKDISITYKDEVLLQQLGIVEWFGDVFGLRTGEIVIKAWLNTDDKAYTGITRLGKKWKWEVAGFELEIKGVPDGCYSLTMTCFEKEMDKANYSQDNVCINVK